VELEPKTSYHGNLCLTTKKNSFVILFKIKFLFIIFSFEMDSDLRNKIYFCGRFKYFQTMQSSAMEGIKRYPNDVSYRLLNGFALVLNGRYQESIRELDSLYNLKEYGVGAIVALIYAHKSCQTVDKEALEMLEEKLKSDRKSSTKMGLYFAALFFYFKDKFEKAREYLDRHLKQNSESLDGLCLKVSVTLF